MKTLKKGTAHEVYTPKAEVDICLNCPLIDLVISIERQPNILKQKKNVYGKCST